ncbi:MAG TPA: DUF5916 domain-containing protein [Fimbriimonas sp.]|nr:DUF5916 domain-containing protein [Fimbriimonas sp.]
MMKIRHICLPITFALAVPAVAQDVAPVAQGKMLTKVPTIDGKIAMGEWDEAHTSDEFRDVSSQKTPDDKTKIFIGYTSKSIYVAFYCYEKDPSKIVARETIPNAQFQGEDQVFLMLNPYGNRNFNQFSNFSVNPLGTKAEQIAGGRTDKREWRGDWKAATSIVEDGWICEMEIPWAMLNYPAGENRNMDLNFARGQGKNQYWQRWANARQNPLPELEGIWQGVTPPAPPRPKIQFLGYTAPEVNKGEFQNRVGLDARYQFTPSFTGVASFAPDFRNIQDQVAGINFVRTERFLNESRPFFSEGSGFFSMGGMFDYARMFYSRRVTDFDAAVKTYGQVTPKLAVGALYTNKFDGQKVAAFSAQHTLSPNRRFQYFGTLDSAANGNEAFGFSYSTQKKGVSFDTGMSIEKSNGQKFDSAGSVSLTKEGGGDLHFLRYIWVQPDFSPSLGLVDWQDRRGFYYFTESNKEYKTGPWRRGHFELYVPQFETYSGTGQEKGFDLGFYFEDKKYRGVQMGWNKTQYDTSHDDNWFIAAAVNQNDRRNKIGARFQSGMTNNLPSKYIAAEYNRRFLPGLDFTLIQSIQELAGTAKQTVGTLAYQISPKELISSRVVQRGADQNIFFSYRRAGFAGAEYYFIYGDPNAIRTTNRLSFKAIWAF